jgi:hypothetical protein
MDKEEQAALNELARRYFTACATRDYSTIRETTTPTLYRRFGITLRKSMFLVSFVLGKPRIEDVRVVSIEAGKAYVDCSFTVGKRRQHERYVCLEEPDGWRVDGKLS